MNNKLQAAYITQQISLERCQRKLRPPRGRNGQSKAQCQLFNDDELTLLTRAVNAGVNISKRVEEYVTKHGADFLCEPKHKQDFLSVLQG
ncbi:hypothetical protein [Vibrio agarivorans]|uniref:Uncharacterized protein n=1 Tax=Vibrio agarivorans TaxID=153622 RepID=A0ABT7Y7I8_9VIBR|nr:hypothetical protein [Vibrio agarivorans]MDN2483960.1 hypothetical protein [Vibrio agarivorans]